MNIYLIRHGRQDSTLCNVDVPLAEEGVRQAKLLGERLTNYSVDILYSSNLKRAKETAGVINQYVKVPHIIREELRETSFGHMEGIENRDTKIIYKDFFKELKTLKEDIPYPGGENGEDTYNRALHTIHEICSSHRKNVAVVTHGGVIRSFLCGMIKIPFHKKLLFGISLENTSITHVVYDQQYQRFYLERFNDYAHLEGEPKLLRKNWNNL